MKSIFDKIQEAQRDKQNIVLCTVVNAKGSTPRREGAKMLVYETGNIYGTIGGGDLEKKVIENALVVLKERKPKLYKHDLLHQHNMCCGGTVEIFIEPIMRRNILYIFGAGHTGKSLAKYASDFDFEVILIDDRKEYLDEFEKEGVNKMCLAYQQALQLLPFDENVYVCIMTYSHPMDREILSFCMKKPYTYLGMIGSERKVEMTKKMLIEAGIGTKEELHHIDMPMGLEIEAEGPEEIAISILAKLIKVKNENLKIST